MNKMKICANSALKIYNVDKGAVHIVGEEGLEPSRIAPYASETYAYTSSATRPKNYLNFHCFFVFVYHSVIPLNLSEGEFILSIQTPFISLLIAQL